MSTSTPDTDTSSIREKKHSPSASPQSDAKPRSDDAQPWNFDDKQLADSALGDTPKVQLPSIFSTFEDPFRNDIRHASLPSISSDSASNTRYRSSPYSQPATRRPHAPANQPSPSTYHFPSSVDTQDPPAEKSRLNYTYSEASPYHQPSPPSAPASASQMSSFVSSLTPDLRQQGPYVEPDEWSNSASAIPRTSNSTPALNAPLKYEDSLRHSSFSAHIGRPYPTGAHKSDEWSFPNQEFVLPPSNPSYNSTSTSLPPSQPPTPSAVSPPSPPSSRPPQTVPSSTLVDRPTKKRGKLPKETTDYLKAWLHRHSDHPYPSEEEKKQLCHATGLSMSQVSNWMINVSHPSFMRRSLLTRPAPGTAQDLSTRSQGSLRSHYLIAISPYNAIHAYYHCLAGARVPSHFDSAGIVAIIPPHVAPVDSLVQPEPRSVATDRLCWVQPASCRNATEVTTPVSQRSRWP